MVLHLPFGWKLDTFGVRILHFDGHDVLATGLFDGHYTISARSELIRLHDSRVAVDVDNVRNEISVSLYRHDIGRALLATV